MTNRGVLAACGALCTALLAAGAWFAPLPYVVQLPGPTVDTLGPDLITVTGAEVSPSAGRLLLTTIAVDGDVDAAKALRTWSDDRNALVPRETVYPAGRSDAQVRRANQALFEASGDTAVAAALARVDEPAGVRVEVAVDEIGGPSAGLMIMLGVIDKLTPADLTGGQVVAGTGEIRPDGTVGPIGGIPQKLAGAAQAEARFFLVPADNCAEAVRAGAPAPALARVATVDDALTALRTIAAGGQPRTC